MSGSTPTAEDPSLLARKASRILLGMATVMGLLGIGVYTYFLTQVSFSWQTYGPSLIGFASIISAFSALGLWARRRPYAASVAGLILYTAIAAPNYFVTPSDLLHMFWIELIVYAFLFQALDHGREFHKQMKAGPPTTSA